MAKGCNNCGHRIYCMCQNSCVNEGYIHHLPDDEVADPVYEKVEEKDLTKP